MSERHQMSLLKVCSRVRHFRYSVMRNRICFTILLESALVFAADQGLVDRSNVDFQNAIKVFLDKHASWKAFVRRFFFYIRVIKSCHARLLWAYLPKLLTYLPKCRARLPKLRWYVRWDGRMELSICDLCRALLVDSII